MLLCFKQILNNYAKLWSVSRNKSQFKLFFYIPDYINRILIISGSRLGKTNVLLNLIKNQRPDIDKINLYVKDQFQSKYQFVFNGRQKVGIKKWKIQKH